MHALASTLFNVRNTLDLSWDVHAWISADSNVSRSVVQRLCTVPRLRLALDRGTLRLRQANFPNEASWSGFNRLYATQQFWRTFTTPHVLMFHIDSCLCGRPTRSLKSFLEGGWTFIGAPWPPSNPLSCQRHPLAEGAVFANSHRHVPRPARFSCVGNTGLSLWRSDDMVKLTSAVEASGRDEYAAYIDHFTDFWASGHIQTKQIALGLGGVPNETEAALFAIETFDPLPETTPVGFHLARGQLHGNKFLGMEKEQMLALRCPQITSIFYRLEERHGNIPTRHN